MLRKIAFTFSSRLFVTGINFLVILLTARYLGAEGRGVISLLMLGITINLLVSNVFGGAAISYLAPRKIISRLLVPAYGWAVVSSLLVTAVLVAIRLVPEEIGLHLLFLSLLQSMYNVHLNVLIGTSRIREHNLVNVLQVSILMAGLATGLIFLGRHGLDSYITPLYVSLAVSLGVTVYFLRHEFHFFPPREWLLEWKALIGNGSIIQLASIAQLLNYRFSYYLLDHLAAIPEEGKKMVGVYSTAVAIAEAVWLVGRSMGLVQYTRILKEQDQQGAIRLTLLYGKVSLIISVLILLPLLLLPSVIYGLVFGPAFERIPSILLMLVPGVLSFAMALMFSNYFAGFGLNRVNLHGSLWGLGITLMSGLILVPVWGMTGAALTATLSYLGTAFYLVYTFLKRTGLPMHALWPGKNDFTYVKEELKKRLKKF